MYKIKLPDGIELNNLELNGNNFISANIIDSQIFENNLATVTIHNGETETAHNDMKLIQNKITNGESWFILAEKTLEEKRNELIDREMNEQVEIIADILGGVFSA